MRRKTARGETNEGRSEVNDGSGCGWRSSSNTIPHTQIRDVEGDKTNPPQGCGQSSGDVSHEDVSRDKWPDHLNSGHLGTQSSEDVSGEGGWTTMGQGISEIKIARMSQATVA